MRECAGTFLSTNEYFGEQINIQSIKMANFGNFTYLLYAQAYIVDENNGDYIFDNFKP